MNADLCFKFSKTAWEELSERLDGNDENEWATAIGVFERRMRERFFSSIDALFAADTKPDLLPPDSTRSGDCIPGFSIMALCCLLIETLQGFLEKAPTTAAASVGTCTFPNGPCIRPTLSTNQQFQKFLRRPAFHGAFDDNIAGLFVNGIRNGILHEAETREWVIWRDEPADKIVDREQNGFALNRSLFYEAVKKSLNRTSTSCATRATNLCERGSRKKWTISPERHELRTGTGTDPENSLPGMGIASLGSS